MRESLQSIQKAPVLRDTFNSEQNTRLLGATPTIATYTNGTAYFSGAASTILYPIKKGTGFSVRIKLIAGTFTLTGTRFIFDNRVGTGTNTFYYSGGAIATTQGTVYVDGVATTTFTSSSKEIIVTGITLDSAFFRLMSDYAGTGNSIGTVELLEVYDYTLTANEVANLANNARYEQLQYASGVSEILNIDAKNGVIANKWNTTLTNTAVTPTRAGNIWAMNFNGTSSILNCGNYDSLVGDKTIVAWYFYNPYSTMPAPRLIDNGKLYIYSSYSDPRYWYMTSNGSTTVSSGIMTSPVGRWKQIVVTRTSTGVANFYIDGVLSGTANQASGTPVAGTLNISIGAYVPSYTDQAFRGQMSAVRIINGILTAQEVSQLFSNERRNYGI